MSQSKLKNTNFLFYSFLHYFFSGVGQSYLISVFKPEWIKTFNLTNEEFSIAYSIITLISGLIIPSVGLYIDKYYKKSTSISISFVIFSLCIGLFYFESKYFFLFGLFGLRFLGQGCLPLIGGSLLLKHNEKNRGKKLAFATLGVTVGEALLSFLFTWLIIDYNWRFSMLILSALVLFIFIPAIILLVKKGDTYVNPHSNSKNKNNQNKTFYLTDFRFYLLSLYYIFPMFFLTGFFIQRDLVEKALGYPAHSLSWGFFAYGTVRAVASIGSGWLIDKFKAVNIFSFSNIPLAIGLIWLSYNTNASLGFLFLVFAGISNSFAGISSNAMWAELYGTEKIATIKGTVTSMMIISTSLGVVVFGYFIKVFENITSLFHLASGYIFIFSLCSFIVLKTRKSY